MNRPAAKGDQRKFGGPERRQGYDVIVVGAGASGMMAAGRAGERGARVLLLEKMPKAGLKLGITGKGRCNLTNEGDLQTFLKNYYPDGRFLRNCFARFFNRELMRFFEERGVPLSVERGGRVFPASARALDVVSALLGYIRKGKVLLLKERPVREILIRDGFVQGVATPFETFEASSVVLACGGASYPQTGSSGDGYLLALRAGHRIVPIRPHLVPLEVEEPWVKDLQGLSLKHVRATILTEGRRGPSEFGEMLFTHFGVSGPIVLSLSGYAVDVLHEGKVEISVNLKPALTTEQLEARLQREFRNHPAKELKTILTFLLPMRLVPLFLERSALPGGKKGGQITVPERKRLLHLLTDFRLTVKGHRPLAEAIVTAGGVDVKEVNPMTMESRLVRGLFLCGEVLDIQGKTGGYNLQAAFSTGWTAGEQAGRTSALNERD